MNEEKQHHKNLKHYNTRCHAHELTFSCYRRKHFFDDVAACQIFIEELGCARIIYSFNLWAYVLMPHHVHLLICPLNNEYDIGKIESGIKGVMAKRYRKYLFEHDNKLLDTFIINENNFDRFVFWQRGGGFDRNLWNAKALHASIKYIEANPVRAGLAAKAADWVWSSAFARVSGNGVIPDVCNIPVDFPNP